MSLNQIDQTKLETVRNRLGERVSKEGLASQIDALTVDKLGLYLALLIQKGEVLNLVADLNLDVLIEKHVLDCIAAVPYFLRRRSIADVGSGAGFPGIPLAVLLGPNNPICLIESKRKKSNFLSEVKLSLDLDHIAIWNGNVFEMERYVFDIITARAFGTIEKILKWTKGLRHQKTEYLLYKGRKRVIREELKAISDVRDEWNADIYALPTYGSDVDERHCVHLWRTEGQMEP